MSEKIFPSNRQDAGPFDSSETELPVGFLDFGAIRMVAKPGVGIKLEVEEATSKVVALTLDFGESTLQVSVFAAPKHEGVWAEVMQQLSESIKSAGGTTSEYLGQLGPGLNAAVNQPDGSKRAIRFIGVDGPRWFIRGSISGKALVDVSTCAEVESLFRELVVHRGDAPMPPKEPLELVVPAGIITPPRPGL